MMSIQIIKWLYSSTVTPKNNCIEDLWGDLLRSIPCVRVWHWKMRFSHGLQNHIKVLPHLTIYQSIDKKCMGQPPRVFIDRWGYILIVRCVTPWHILFYFEVKWLQHCEIIIICLMNDVWTINDKNICLRSQEGAT